MSIVSDPSASELRAEAGMTAATESSVSIVTDDSVCAAVMSAFEASVGKTWPESFVIVRLDQPAGPFYYMTPRRDGALTTRYLLDPHFKRLAMIGT